jgi:hypothetical protein
VADSPPPYRARDFRYDCVGFDLDSHVFRPPPYELRMSLNAILASSSTMRARLMAATAHHVSSIMLAPRAVPFLVHPKIVEYPVSSR